MKRTSLLPVIAAVAMVPFGVQASTTKIEPEVTLSQSTSSAKAGRFAELRARVNPSYYKAQSKHLCHSTEGAKGNG